MEDDAPTPDPITVPVFAADDTMALEATMRETLANLKEMALMMSHRSALAGLEILEVIPENRYAEGHRAPAPGGGNVVDLSAHAWRRREDPSAG